MNVEALIDAEYISSQAGSTGHDLAKAAESIGLKGTVLAGLGVNSLYAAESPLILHAAPMGSHSSYQHWILFLGFDDTGSARVIDGKVGVARCSKEEVLARWDGIAIAVRRHEMAGSRYLSSELSGLLSLAAISAMFSLIVSRTIPGRPFAILAILLAIALGERLRRELP